MAATAEDDLNPLELTAPSFIYGAFVAAMIILLHPTAMNLAGAWFSSSSFHHGIFVAPIALWMIIANARMPESYGSRIPGHVIVLGAGILWLMGRAAGVALIEQVAFVTLLIGGAGVAFGMNALLAWAYPMLFLYFMVPFGETLIPALQTLTAKTVVFLLSALDSTVSLDGYLIKTPAGVFEVGEACAGLRFLIAALMIAAIFAYISFQHWRKRIVFLMFAVALALVANGARAFLLVLIATLTEKRWAVGPDHLLIGWLFYAGIFLVLILVGRRFADPVEPIKTEKQNTLHKTHALAPMAPAFAVLAAITFYATLVIDRSGTDTAPPSLTLMNAPGWRILPPPENWRAGPDTADRTAAATYATGDQRVYLSLGFYSRDRRGAEIVNYHNRPWNGVNWRKAGNIEEVLYLFGESERHRLDILAGPERRRLAVVTAYWLNNEVYLDPRRLKFEQMKAKLRGKNPSGGVIMTAASFQRDPMEAVATIRAFMTDVEPFGDWLARNTGD